MHKTTELTMDGNLRTTVSHRLEPRIQGSWAPLPFPTSCGCMVSVCVLWPWLTSACILLLSGHFPPLGVTSPWRLLITSTIVVCAPHSCLFHLASLLSFKLLWGWVDWFLWMTHRTFPSLPSSTPGANLPASRTTHHDSPIPFREPELFSVPLLKQQWTLLFGKVFINIHPPSHGFH